MSRLIELEKQIGDVDELGGVFLENSVDEVENRINPYRLKFNKNGEPEFKYEKETELGMAEYNGLKNVFNLAKFGYKYVFWLSPEGGKSIYDQGRISVGIVKNKEEVEIECRGVPILVTADELFEMGKKIVDYGGESIEKIEKPEDLREQAIGINLRSDEDLWKLCESIFGMEKVWKTILKGKDIRRKSEVMSAVDNVLIEIRKYYGNFTTENSIESGAYLEREMQIRGYGIAGGNHGNLNSSLMGDTGFNELFSNSEISVKLEVKDGKKYCPCGVEVKDGVSVCPSCGLKLSKSS
jgi:hypothetical protein